MTLTNEHMAKLTHVTYMPVRVASLMRDQTTTAQKAARAYHFAGRMAQRTRRRRGALSVARKARALLRVAECVWGREQTEEHARGSSER